MNVTRLLLPAILLGFALISCSDTGTDPDDPVQVVVPTAYEYESRFQEGESSVSYGGQIVRNLLVNDLRSAISATGQAGASAVTLNDLLALYDHDDANNLSIMTSTGTVPALQQTYSEIATEKNLTGKISGEVLYRTGMTVDAQIREWLQTIATNSAMPSRLGTPMAYTTDEGLDLSQLVEKVLLGAVAYYQASGVYLEGIEDRQNQQPHSDGALYTSMEHAWDEAFGYFGAARDYSRYTDAALAGGVNEYVFDSNNDGAIDFQSEFNYPFARGAGKRDVAVPGRDFSATIFEAFLRGRAVISQGGTEQELLEARADALIAWERLIAANVAHYINETLDDIENLNANSSASNSPDLNKHWAEAKGYAWALQFNPRRIINDLRYNELHNLLGDAPEYAHTGVPNANFRSNLNLAKALLKEAYGFSDQELNAW